MYEEVRAKSSMLLGAQNTTLRTFTMQEALYRKQTCGMRWWYEIDKGRNEHVVLCSGCPERTLAWSISPSSPSDQSTSSAGTLKRRGCTAHSQAHPTLYSHLEYGLPHLVRQALAEALDLQ